MKNINIENSNSTSTVATPVKTARKGKGGKFATVFAKINETVPTALVVKPRKVRDDFARAVKCMAEIATGTAVNINGKGKRKTRILPTGRVVERVLQVICMGMKGDAIVLNAPGIEARCPWSSVEADIMHVAKEMGADLISVRTVFGFTPEQEALDTAIAEKRALAAKAEADVAVARANSAAKHVAEKKVRANGANGASVRG